MDFLLPEKLSEVVMAIGLKSTAKDFPPISAMLPAWSCVDADRIREIIRG